MCVMSTHPLEVVLPMVVLPTVQLPSGNSTSFHDDQPSIWPLSFNHKVPEGHDESSCGVAMLLFNGVVCVALSHVDRVSRGGRSTFRTTAGGVELVP